MSSRSRSRMACCKTSPQGRCSSGSATRKWRIDAQRVRFWCETQMLAVLYPTMTAGPCHCPAPGRLMKVEYIAPGGERCSAGMVSRKRARAREARERPRRDRDTAVAVRAAESSMRSRSDALPRAHK